MYIRNTTAASLLVGCVVAGFAGGQSLQTACAPFQITSTYTSLSTRTATSYSHRYETGMTTVYEKMILTTTETYTYDYRTPQLLVKYNVRILSPSIGLFQVNITNLMNLPILNGTGLFLIFGTREFHGTWLYLDFGPIEPQGRWSLKKYIDLSGAGWASVQFGYIHFRCTRELTEVPVATRRYTRTMVATHLEVDTITYTSSKVLFLSGVSELLLILSGVLVVAFATLMVKRFARPSQGHGLSHSGQRICSSCGTLLQPEEDFCPNCGERGR